MSGTLASLGLPDPTPAKSDTLTTLGLPKPTPVAAAAPVRQPMWPAHAPTAHPEREVPLEANPLDPITSLPGLFTAGPAMKLANGATSALPWLAQSAARNALAAASMGVVNDVGSKRNPLPAVLPNAAAGAILGPPLEGAAGLVGRGVASILRRGPNAPVAAPVETPAVSPVEAPAAQLAEGPRPMLPGPQGNVIPPRAPVTTTNAQQFPLMEDFRAQVKADPAYLERLKALGGGRVVSNEETLSKAWAEGPMHPDELSAWPADAPINPVTQTRGLLTLDYFQQARLRAIGSGDLKAAADANEMISRLLPGVENLRATGGRTTQAQAMFVQDEMTKALNELSDMQAKGVPFEQVRQRANEIIASARAADRMKGLGGQLKDAIGQLETAATFAKLTSPVTHAVNTISNALTFAMRPIEKGAAAATYLAQGNRAAAEGEVSSLFGTTMGFRSGMERYLTTLMDDAGDAGKMIEVKGNRNIPLPKALRPLDVFRQLSAADAFWKGVLRDSRLHELAYTSARQEGLAGPQLAERVRALVEKPPASWATEADAYAQEYTFQSSPDRFLKAVQKIQGLPLVRLFVPFVQTPYNLAKFQFQRSAGGILSPRNVTGLMAGGKAQAEAVGRLTAGMALSAGGLALVNSTDATGDYPSDPHEKARWVAEGIKPYSIRLPSGQWLAYNRFAPVGMYIGQAVSLRDAIQRGDEQGIAGAASSLAGASMKQINDMPFLSGLSDMLDAIKQPDRSAAKFAEGVVTGFVPNILRDARQQADSTMRVARGVPDAVQNMIPGLSQRLPASIDVLGRARTYEPNRLTRATKVLSTTRDTRETKVLDDAGWFPTPPKTQLTKKGYAPVTLTKQDAERFQREMGEATRAALMRFDTPTFRALDPEEKQKRLEKAVNDAREVVRNRWKRDRFKTKLVTR